MLADPRPCPLCGSPPKGTAFPWASRYAGAGYRYFACSACATRYIDPVPDDAAMARMYGSGEYHEEFYEGEGHSPYQQTAARIAAQLPPGARVLDYGCGAGHLIAALKACGLDAEGAEFSAAAASNAAAKSGCRVHDLSAGDWQATGPWDAIHLGDVIEHLADPRETLAALLPLVHSGGLVSAEGPIEANASLVGLAIQLFGHAKRVLRPQSIGEFPPYHLLFTSASAQRAFFQRLPALSEVHWQVSENGWPYRGNGAARNLIALAAIATAKLPGLALGNRFSVLLRKG
jgi:SAM-dependent methyltransferase